MPDISHDEETSPETLNDSPGGGKRPVRTLGMGLVVLWSADEPDYVGAWLPIRSEEATQPRVFGRGPARADDRYPRLSLLRQRPTQNELLAPLNSAALSRVQLELRATGPGVLEVVNVGRRQLLVNGVLAERHDVRPGDVLEIGTRLALMGAARASSLDGLAPPASHAFGEADEHGWVGESPAAWRVRSEIAFAAQRTGHVLILGETGTGKELAAAAIHAAAGRSGPLVSRNAATIPESLVDAELFGNPKGYPNPGIPEREGLIGAAHRGSLFLDEFADLPAGAQAHILRVLDSGEYQRLGESTVRKSEFRLIAATNRPESSLRRDILARFDFRIVVPNLSARREDIPLLLRHLFGVATEDSPDLRKRYALPSGAPRLGPGFIRRLVQHPFSGNVRELRQILWRSLRDSSGDALTWSESGDTPGPEDAGDDLPRAEIQRALDANNGSLEKTWRTLGLPNRYALRRLVTKHGLVITRRRGGA